MPELDHDVTIVGGGPAGLQAALTLGRVHRRVLLLDSGRYRNDPADHMHNVLGHDGRTPAELRATGRTELGAYPTVTVLDATAESVAALPDDEGFAVRHDGGTASARRVVLATGVCDTLPAVPGLADLFGTLAAHCPFCHGHEYAGTTVAVIGAGDRAGHVAAIMAPVAAEVVVPAQPVVSVRRADSGERAVLSFAEAPDLEVGGIIVATTFTQSAPFAAQLGLRLLPSGCVEVDPMGRTSCPGVYAAGDLAHLAALPMPMSSVVGALAAGQAAGAGCVADEVATR